RLVGLGLDTYDRHLSTMVEYDAFERSRARSRAAGATTWNYRIIRHQSQFSALLELEPKSDRVQSVLNYANHNLHKPLSVKQLAEVARLSPRQFSRAFQAETGQSPAKAIENLRLEAARMQIEWSRHPIDQIALQTGFGDPGRMRRAFLWVFGQPPQVI